MYEYVCELRICKICYGDDDYDEMEMIQAKLNNLPTKIHSIRKTGCQFAK